jgi:peptidoglycan/xylan/chitin deacetylase (PgdA/CDA1 family)
MLFTIILFPSSPILGDYDHQLAFASQTTMINNNDNNSNANGSTSSINKQVILNFYDDDKSQFTNAKPILDKYGCYFIVCNWANSNDSSRMTWQEISQLYREGHDIESHSITHKRDHMPKEKELITQL